MMGFLTRYRNGCEYVKPTPCARLLQSRDAWSDLALEDYNKECICEDKHDWGTTSTSGASVSVEWARERS